MALIFNSTTTSEEYHRDDLSLQQLKSKVLKESKGFIKLPSLQMSFQQWCFDGFRLALSKFENTAGISYRIVNDVESIKIYFNRKGVIDITYHQPNHRSRVWGGELNILYSKELETTISHVHGYSEIFSLQLTRDCFEGLMDEYKLAHHFTQQININRVAIASGQWLDSNVLIEKCISDIVDCKYNNDFKKLYLRAKAMELFVHVFNLNFGTQKKLHFLNTTTDRQKLHAIRDYLIENCTDAISLKDISQTFALNEFKLKGGFKALFGTSVIDFLLSKRLEHAHQLLNDKAKNISEVAYDCGYSSPQYFSKAFKKKFGVSPKDAK
ncbi:MAG TPA: AraC family transcriptional regulator [Cyclobacteriaceae bacterium]